MTTDTNKFIAAALDEMAAVRKRATRETLFAVAKHCDELGLKFEVRRPHGRGVIDGFCVKFTRETPNQIVEDDRSRAKQLVELVTCLNNHLQALPAMSYVGGKWTFPWGDADAVAEWLTRPDPEPAKLRSPVPNPVRYIDKGEAAQWQAVVNSLQAVDKHLSQVVTYLVVRLGQTEGRVIDAVKEAEVQLAGLAYLCTPQPEWMGGDSEDERNYKIRAPHGAMPSTQEKSDAT